MSKKKSYMDSRNILTEARMSKFLNWLFKGKDKKIDKEVKENPEFKKRVAAFNKEYDAFMKRLQKKFPNQDPRGVGWDKDFK